MSYHGRWDIFCTVIDNFGDAGVSWRLARQLAGEHGRQVHLWVDNLAALRQICPAADPLGETQQLDGVSVCRWDDDADPAQYASTGTEVVIEAFACQLPEPYLEALAANVPPPVWLNLEYLSAEGWVEDCHGLPSIHPRLPLTKYFFFPGFTGRTGGLLRERDLLARRDAFRRDPQARLVFLANLDVAVPVGARVFSLFSYESPAIAGWLGALADAALPTLCLVPAGRALTPVAAWLGCDRLHVGDRHERGNLTVRVLPFLPQDSYDRLLWSCDFNVVRGEDSLVRAHWAGRPFCWQIYPQADSVHLAKLDAFLALLTADAPPGLAAALRMTMHAWAGEGDIAEPWAMLERHWADWQCLLDAWVDRLAARPDLTASLVAFCAAHRPDC